MSLICRKTRIRNQRAFAAIARMPFLIDENLRHRKRQTLGPSLLHGRSDLGLIIKSSGTLYHQRLIDNVPIEAVVKRYNAAPSSPVSALPISALRSSSGTPGTYTLEESSSNCATATRRWLRRTMNGARYKVLKRAMVRAPNAIAHQALSHLYAHLLNRAKRHLGLQAAAHSRPN